MATRCGRAMEVEQYSYHHGQAVDLGPVMPATQFRVTDEAGTYFLNYKIKNTPYVHA